MGDRFDRRTWDDPYRAEPAYEGIQRRVLASTDEMMMVHYTVERDAVFPEHEHDETHQAVFVVEGAVALFGDHEATLERGDSFVVGPGERHGIRGVAEESRLVDTFAPPITEYAND